MRSTSDVCILGQTYFLCFTEVFKNNLEIKSTDPDVYSHDYLNQIICLTNSLSMDKSGEYSLRFPTADKIISTKFFILKSVQETHQKTL